MPFATESIRIAHRLRIARVDTGQVFVARNLRVGEFADQMPRDRTAKNPSRFLGRLFGEGIEFSSRNLGGCMVVRLDSFENYREIGNQ